jgi:hypothetical protein
MKQASETKQGIANTDLVVLALLLCGGGERYIDLEHIAVMCFKLAPPQFRWTLYDYPSLDSAHHAVRNLIMRRPDLLRKPKTQKSTERMLTAAGINHAIHVGSLYLNKRLTTPAEVMRAFSGFVNGSEVEAEHQEKRAGRNSDARPAQQELRLVRKHDTFKEWKRGTPLNEIEKWRFADLLKCLPDSPNSVWEERLQRLQAQAAWWQDNEISRFLNGVEKAIRA